MDLYNCCSDGVKWGWVFFFCNILSFCWHLLHSYHCLERPSQVSISFVYCCSDGPSQVKSFFLLFLATFSILFFHSIISPLFWCTYLKIEIWLDKIKWRIFFLFTCLRKFVEPSWKQYHLRWVLFKRVQPGQQNLIGLNQSHTTSTKL